MKSTALISAGLLAIGLAAPALAWCTCGSYQAPLETVKKIGNRLIDTTPFSYRLTLARATHAFDGLRTVDFTRSLDPSEHGVAYAYTRLFAPADTTLQVQIAHGGSCGVWCNGTNVYTRRDAGPLSYTVDERSVELPYTFSLTLKAGPNDLLVKSEAMAGDWRVMLQPPGFLDAVLDYTPVTVGMGLAGLPFVGADVAEASDWLVVGPLDGPFEMSNGPEKAVEIGRMYKGPHGAVTWTVPRMEVLGTVIDPAPWGTAYQWNYHNGGVAWAMQAMGEYSGQDKYCGWARDFCDYHLDGIPFVDYQTNTLLAFDSSNSRILDCPLLDFTLAPALPFMHRLVAEGAFPGRRRYEAFADRMLGYAARQVKSPGMDNYARVTPEKYTVWVDDMFMGIPFLVRASEYVGDSLRKAAYLDEAARQILDFNRHVWDKKANLYMHASYSSRPDVKLPHWSRANGWGLWAMAEVLEALPPKHPLYGKILGHFRRHAASLVKLQGPDGLWHNVLDRANSPSEVSGSAIFVMAMARGVRLGWLPADDYMPVVERGWKGVASRVDDDGTVHDICVGTMCSADEEYYVHRPFYDNDTHGSFAVIFCGVEVQKLLDKIASSSCDTRFVPARPGAEEVAYIRRDLESKHPSYDPEVHMLYTVTADSHYHSDLPGGTRVHQTRESLEYAVALLKTGDSAFTARALDIIRAVLPLQEHDSSLSYCGVWPYYPEDPLKDRKAPVDYNWADFIAVPLIDVVVNHGDILDRELKDSIGRALVLAAGAVRRRDVQPDYTNMAIMGTYVCYAVGDLYHRGDLKNYARARLRKFHVYTCATKGFTEYNSPTYTVVALNELLRLRQCVADKEDLALVNDLYESAWNMVGCHFHGPSGQWCGPNLRSYSNLISRDNLRLFYNASGGRIEVEGDYPRYPNVLQPHEIPAAALETFTDARFPRLQTDTFVARADRSPIFFDRAGRLDSVAPRDIVGRVYMTPAYALASVSQGYMWNQTRPLIAHFGTPAAPGYLRVRFLHDGYDFSAVNIFSAQDSTSVVSVFNISSDGGDRHPSIDRIPGRRFAARDLRLRIEMGGSAATGSFTLPAAPGSVLGIDTGGPAFRACVPYMCWDGCEGRWEQGSDGETAWADYVLYSGEMRTFDLGIIREAVLAFCLSAGEDMPRVDARPEGEYLRVNCGKTGVRALRKPDNEHRIQNDYAINE